MLRFSTPLLLNTLLAMVAARINVVLLGTAMPSEQVGIFDLVFQISLVGGLFLTSFNMVFAPMVADLSNRNQHAELQSLYQTATRWILTLALPVFAGIVLFAPQLLAIFGPDFAPGAPALIILAAAQLVNVAVGAVGYLLVMSGHPAVTAANSLVGLVLTVGLNLWLVPSWGLLGAATAQAVMLTTVNVLGLAAVWRLLKLQPFSRAYVKPFAAVLVSAAAGWLGVQALAGVEAEWWAEILAGGGVLVLVYLAVLVFLHLEPEDRAIVEAGRRRLFDRAES
jgi:O-antigen/teichoic acid export membrane protein